MVPKRENTIFFNVSHTPSEVADGWTKLLGVETAFENLKKRPFLTTENRKTAKIDQRWFQPLPVLAKLPPSSMRGANLYPESGFGQCELSWTLLLVFCVPYTSFLREESSCENPFLATTFRLLLPTSFAFLLQLLPHKSIVNSSTLIFTTFHASNTTCSHCPPLCRRSGMFAFESSMHGPFVLTTFKVPLFILLLRISCTDVVSRFSATLFASPLPSCLHDLLRKKKITTFLFFSLCCRRGCSMN